ncbi:hypothetical protein [Sphingobacterium siyangense]|uniref:hypothetical protein n=1 Tax=Sphingobacterium siyangense TaxID=459529 RepID=UPI0030186502
MKYIPSTRSQNSMIGYQISRLKIDTETKEEMIWLYTDGRTTKISELRFDEASNVIKALLSGQAKYETPKSKMIRKMLSMAHEMNWEHSTGAIDMDRVNKWVNKYGQYKKNINLYTEAELPALVTAFEKMYLKHIKG